MDLIGLIILIVIVIALIVYRQYSDSRTCLHERQGATPLFHTMQHVLPPREFSSSEKKIPRIIHQTHKSMKVPTRMHAAFRKWIETNPTYEHRYYDDLLMHKVVHAHPNARVSEAFDLLKARYPLKGAIHVDLFRLVIMQQVGGVYVDADTLPVDGSPGLEELIKHDDEYLSGIGTRLDLHQFYIVAVSHHPFVTAVLDAVLDIILTGDEDDLIEEHDVEGIAGPPRYDRAVRSFLAEQGSELKLVEGTHSFTVIKDSSTHKYRIMNGNLMGNTIIFKYEGYFDDIKALGANYWSE